MAKRKAVDPQEMERVYNHVESFIINNQKLCTSTEVSKALELGRAKIDKHIDNLVSAGRLRIVFEIPKKVRLFAPAYMVKKFSKNHSRILWMDRYSFPQKVELEKKKVGLEGQLEDFEQFELLLSSTGRELVNALAHSLRWLGFQVEVKEEEGNQDVEIKHDTYLAIIEVKGLEDAAKIKDLRQAVDYHLRKVDETGNGDIATILIVNHFRLLEPDKRGDAFSEAVVKAVKKHYGFVQLLATISLYNAIGEILAAKSTKDDVIEKVKQAQLADQ